MGVKRGPKRFLSASKASRKWISIGKFKIQINYCPPFILLRMAKGIGRVANSIKYS